MKLRHKFILLSALALVHAPAFSAAGWSAPLTITALVPVEDSLKLTVTGNDNLMSCSSPGWARISSTNSNYSVITSAIITAFAQGKPVKAWVSGCDVDGASHFIAAWIDK